MSSPKTHGVLPEQLTRNSSAKDNFLQLKLSSMLNSRWVSIRPHNLLLSQWLCPACQLRLSRPSRQASTLSQTAKPSPSEPKGPSEEDFRPEPLSRPLGQNKPPKPGENSGIDHRTWRQRREDFFNYDKHLERRKELTRKVAKPYFREWTNMRHHRGKTFLSPPKLFKSEAALYFPNMQGYTIGAPSKTVDTTSVLSGKTSIVSVSSGTWAEWQTQTFVSEAQNPELAKEVERLGKQGLQRVWINIEEDWMKAGLVRLFLGGMRKRWKPEEWGRSFVVRRGVEDDVKMSIGMANGKVGYVYLVDGACKIRWAASGDAVGGEREGLVTCVRRLMENVKMGDTKKIEGGRMEKARKGLKHGGEKKISAVN